MFSIFFLFIILFCIFRLLGFFQLSTSSFYDLITFYMIKILGFYRKTEVSNYLFSYCVNKIIQIYSEKTLLTFFIIFSIFLKILICFFFILSYKFAFVFAFYFIILLILILSIFYILLWELSIFCYYQCVMASDEFEFFEFDSKQNDSYIYIKKNIEIFDYEQFYQTKNHFQLKKDKQEKYKEDFVYEALIKRLTLFPQVYKKLLEIINIYIKVNLTMNIFFCLFLLLFTTLFI